MPDASLGPPDGHNLRLQFKVIAAAHPVICRVGLTVKTSWIRLVDGSAW
jgi:hypothetical protein